MISTLYISHYLRPFRGVNTSTIFEFTRYTYIIKSRYYSDSKIKSLTNKHFEIVIDIITLTRDAIIKVFLVTITRL